MHVAVRAACMPHACLDNMHDPRMENPTMKTDSSSLDYIIVRKRV